MLAIITIVTMLAGTFYSWQLRNKFNRYAQISLGRGYSGAEIAAMMLRDYGVNDVEIICVPGQLTDHYNPADKTVNLSEEVYFGNSAVSAAVAAHEVGHAIQHATNYSMLQFRTALVPLQAASSWILNILFFMMMGGVFLTTFFPLELALVILIATYGVITLFSLITLPVEFDASKRALDWMEGSRIVSSEEHYMAKDALNTAAMTYVVSALGSLATMLYYVMMLLNARSNE
jgi:Zn-dependent membrane protease YugP